MWQIEVSKRCLREVKKAPAYVQERFREIFLSKEEVDNPFDRAEMGVALEKLEGAEACYKVRLGTYRVGLFLDKDQQVVKVVTLFHRRTDYHSFP